MGRLIENERETLKNLRKRRGALRQTSRRLADLADFENGFCIRQVGRER